MAPRARKESPASASPLVALFLSGASVPGLRPNGDAPDREPRPAERKPRRRGA